MTKYILLYKNKTIVSYERLFIKQIVEILIRPSKKSLFYEPYSRKEDCLADLVYKTPSV